MLKYVGDKVKDFFMGLTHVQAGWLTFLVVFLFLAALSL